MEASIIGKSEENPPIPPAADAGAASPPLGILLDDVEQSVADSEARDGDAAATTAVVDPTSEADAALDSILETSVAEVNLALSHHDASTAAAAAAIADAAFQAADIALQAAAVDAVANIDPNTTSDPAITTTSSATTSFLADPAATEIPPQNEQDGEQSSQPTPHEPEQQVAVAASAAEVTVAESTATDSVVAAAAPAATPATATLSGNKRSLSDIMHDEKKDNLVKNLNMNVVAAGPTSEDPYANANAVDSSGYRVGRWTLDEKILFLFGLQKYGKGRWKKVSTYVPQRSLVQIKSHAQKVLKRLEAGEDVFGRLEENVSRLHTLVGQIHQENGLAPPTVILQPPLQTQHHQPPLPPPQPQPSQPQLQQDPPHPQLETQQVQQAALGANPVLAPSPLIATVTFPTATTTTTTTAQVPPEPASTESATTTTVAPVASTDAGVANVPNGTNGSAHKRKLVKKKAPDGTEHILAASALCQLAGPESEGNSSNNSMADAGEPTTGANIAAGTVVNDAPLGTTDSSAVEKPADLVVVVARPDATGAIAATTDDVNAMLAGDEVVDPLLEF